MLFKDRTDAGKQLAQQLLKYKNENPYLFALARGGVPVAHEISKELRLPLDVIVVRKLSFPMAKEQGFGAIAPGNNTVLNSGMVRLSGLNPEEIEVIKNHEEIILIRRLHCYRGSNSMPDLRNKSIILIDDGIATGSTAKAAIQYAKTFKPKKIIMATPVCAVETLNDIKAEVNDVIYLAAPLDFQSVSQWYEEFPQVTDQEVISLLKKSNDYFLSSSGAIMPSTVIF